MRSWLRAAGRLLVIGQPFGPFRRFSEGFTQNHLGFWLRGQWFTSGEFLPAGSIAGVSIGSGCVDQLKLRYASSMLHQRAGGRTRQQHQLHAVTVRW
jgi:hypothetical protein